jgi:hypothetical protein
VLDLLLRDARGAVAVGAKERVALSVPTPLLAGRVVAIAVDPMTTRWLRQRKWTLW